MLPKICFATHNLGKVKEVQALLANHFQVVSLTDIGQKTPIAETEKTIVGNACLKAQYVYDHYGIPCFADDSGLEVHALDGAPGVYSARYAGEAKDDEANIDLLLQNLEGVADRRAQFVTVMAHIAADGKMTTYEGTVQGTITTERIGSDGFGYDPVFRPDGYAQTFAEMPLAEKNQISHRARAIAKLLQGLGVTPPSIL